MCSTIPTWCAQSSASGSRRRPAISAISGRTRRGGCFAPASSMRSPCCRRANGALADCCGTRSSSLFLLGVGEACDEVGANLVIDCPDKPGNGSDGIKNAVVDGFIFGRVEHLNEIEPARLRRLPFVVVDFDPGPNISSVRVDAHAGCLRGGEASHRSRPPPLRHSLLHAQLSGPRAIHPAGEAARPGGRRACRPTRRSIAAIATLSPRPG